MLGLTPERHIAVSVHYVGRGTAARNQVTALAGRQVGRPQKAFPSVADQYIDWHGREVFLSPARVA